jgi:hypothetical protein
MQISRTPLPLQPLKEKFNYINKKHRLKFCLKLAANRRLFKKEIARCGGTCLQFQH